MEHTFNSAHLFGLKGCIRLSDSIRCGELHPCDTGLTPTVRGGRNNRFIGRSQLYG